MKKNIKKILSFALMLSLLVGMMAGFSVFAAEEETPAVEIVSKNVYYKDTLRLMYAVRTNDADVVVNIYDSENNLVETIANYKTENVKGEDLKVFISTIGVPAQFIYTEFYAEAVLSDGTKTDKVRYSVLEYLYERLTVSTKVSDAQKLMYNNLLAYADSLGKLINSEAEEGATLNDVVSDYAYVRVTNGTVDGTYGSAMVKAGTKLDKVTTTLVPGTNMVLAWNVTVNDLENVPSADLVTSEAVADMTVEAGKAYVLTATEIESGVTFVDVTASVKVEDYATANGWENDKPYLNMDINALVTAVASLDPTAQYKNTGKYYTKGNNWRFYQNETANLTITACDNNIVSVKVTYASEKTGILTLNGSNITSGTVVTVNAPSVTFGVGNTDATVTNGQVRITAIEVVYQVPAHDCVYSEATCTAPATCSICGAVNGDKLPHSYDDGVANPAATCTTAGLMVYTCSCGDTKTEVIEALGHTVEAGTCDRCGTEVGGSNTPVENTVSLNIYANKGVKGNGDKEISWTQGDVTVKNEKDKSTTAIRTSDSDHFRVYANSKLTISVEGGAIKEIVITATSSSYATALANSLKAAGYTATASGSTVTVTVTGANVASVEASMGAQTRIKSVKVTYMK